MARSKKNYGKDVRKVGKSADAKKKLIHKMVEALIKEDSASATEHLHAYLQEKMRSIILGEKEDEKDEKEEKDEDEDDEDEDDKKGEKDEDEDDEDEDDEVKESYLGEKWKKSVKVSPSEKGEHSKKSLEQLRKELKSARRAGNTGLERELNFAIRAKQKGAGKWGEVKESEILELIDESLLDEIYTIVLEKKPSAGMSKEEKSKLVKKAKKGEDIGKPGKKFQEIEQKAARRYHSEEIGKKVAGAAMWHGAAKK